MKPPVHEYRDPYHDGKCLTCGGKNPKKTGNCRIQYHGWQAISENAERDRRNWIRHHR